MKMCSRSVCQPLALHQRQEDGDRRRRVEVCVRRHMACVEGQMFVVQGGKVSVHAHPCAHILLHLPLQWPHGTNTQMCGAAAVTCWESHNLYSLSSTVFSLLFIAYLCCHLPPVASFPRLTLSSSRFCKFVLWSLIELLLFIKQGVGFAASNVQYVMSKGMWKTEEGDTHTVTLKIDRPFNKLNRMHPMTAWSHVSIIYIISRSSCEYGSNQRTVWVCL